MKYFAPFDQSDCGTACLRMIANFYGREYSSYYFRKITYLTRQGTSLLSIGKAAELIGFKSLIGKTSINFLNEKAQLPCILYWDKNHFVVLYKIKTVGKFFGRPGTKYFYIADPGVGKVRLKQDIFEKYWLGEEHKGICLFLDPTPEFYHYEPDENNISKVGVASAVSFLGAYFRKYRKNYLQVAFSMLVAAFISILLPFLTQSIVDVGIQNKDINLIAAIVLFQFFFFVSNSFAEIIRSQLLTHISVRINVSILTDFLLKLMRLPISFFDSKMVGDIVQRVGDHNRIEKFISSSLLSTAFSIINFIVFIFVLSTYKISLLGIFLFGSMLSLGYSLLFLKWRRSLDYKRFRELARSGDKLFELVNGMAEIKLNSFEKYKQWEWQEIQVQMFKLNLSNLKLDQYQRIGSEFIDQLKNLLITYIVAIQVVNGHMTLGMMLAVSYVIGQLNVPLRQIVEFINSFQVTKIAIERMNEVYIEREEEALNAQSISRLELTRGRTGIELNNVTFHYEGPESPAALKNVNLFIEEGKVTAIVGSSGSGKTTLLKLLLKFYDPSSGQIAVNGLTLSSVSANQWRSVCGTVMQEGYIFSDTIKRNIILGDQEEDVEKLIKAIEIANIEDYILSLPLNFETRIGASGIGLSTGQKQRILIARAIYKNPKYLFFDEATSALDAKNERVIMGNLNSYFDQKTVIIVAHRLSTVMNADKIVVLENGSVVESGAHYELVARQGAYYSLVRNQLELGV